LRDRLLVTAASLAVLLFVSASCSQTSAPARANADVLLRAASRYWDEIAESLVRSDDPAVDAVAGRVAAVEGELDIPPELRDAFNALLWRVGCLAAFYPDKPTSGSLTALLSERSPWYGIAFVEGGAQDTARALYGAMFETDALAALEACRLLPNPPILPIGVL
jgi:hypothetical protein